MAELDATLALLNLRNAILVELERTAEHLAKAPNLRMNAEDLLRLNSIVDAWTDYACKAEKVYLLKALSGSSLQLLTNLRHSMKILNALYGATETS